MIRIPKHLDDLKIIERIKKNEDASQKSKDLIKIVAYSEEFKWNQKNPKNSSKF